MRRLPLQLCRNNGSQDDLRKCRRHNIYLHVRSKGNIQGGHETAQGYSVLEKANDYLDGSVTCESCHIEKTHPNLIENGGTLDAKVPAHSGFMAIHIDKIDCRSCHIPSVYASPGRLLFRDWTAGAYRQGEGANGNANHFDFRYNFMDGGADRIPVLNTWVTTPHGTKITPIETSMLRYGQVQQYVKTIKTTLFSDGRRQKRGTSQPQRQSSQHRTEQHILQGWIRLPGCQLLGPQAEWNE